MFQLPSLSLCSEATAPELKGISRHTLRELFSDCLLVNLPESTLFYQAVKMRKGTTEIQQSRVLVKRYGKTFNDFERHRC